MIAYLYGVWGVEDPLRRIGVWKGVLMTNGSYGRDSGNAVLAAGKADLVAFGAPFLANPDLPARFRANAPLNPPNPATFYGGGSEGYTDYPFM